MYFMKLSGHDKTLQNLFRACYGSGNEHQLETATNAFKHRHDAIEIALQSWERSKYIFEKATNQLELAHKVSY
jgi:urease accessory protein UreE